MESLHSAEQQNYRHSFFSFFYYQSRETQTGDNCVGHADTEGAGQYQTAGMKHCIYICTDLPLTVLAVRAGAVLLQEYECIYNHASASTLMDLHMFKNALLSLCICNQTAAAHLQLESVACLGPVTPGFPHVSVKQAQNASVQKRDVIRYFTPVIFIRISSIT